MSNQFTKGTQAMKKIIGSLFNIAILFLLSVSGWAQNPTGPTTHTMNNATINSTSSAGQYIKGNLIANVTTVTSAMSPYNVTPGDVIVACDNSGGAVVINMPAATGSRRELVHRLVGSSTTNTCAWTPAGTDVINQNQGPVAGPVVGVWVFSKWIDYAPGVWVEIP